MYKILLVDDHAIVRSGVRLIVENKFDDVQIFEAKNGSMALDRCKQHHFDIIVLDLNLPNTDTLSLISNLHIRQPGLAILIFSMVSEYAFLKPYLNSGIKGYLNKQADNQEVELAIETVIGGKKYFSREILESIADDKLHSQEAVRNPFEELSNREMEITSRLLRGETVSKIAADLNIHSSTVGTHKSRIFEKLHVDNSIALINLARQYNLMG